VNGCVYRSHSLHVRRSPSLALRRRQGIGAKPIGYDDFQAIAKREGEKRRDEQCSSAVRVNQQNRRKIGVLARTHNVRPYECVHGAEANQILSFVNIRTEPNKFDFHNRLYDDFLKEKKND